MNLFTKNLRYFVCFALISLSYTKSFSQTTHSENTVITNLKASVENNRLLINWVISENITSANCEVQASTDGKTFSTIGIVMGADPKQASSFCFKQNINKIRSGKVFYRVINLEADGKASTSNIVKVVS